MLGLGLVGSVRPPASFKINNRVHRRVAHLYDHHLMVQFPHSHIITRNRPCMPRCKLYCFKCRPTVENVVREPRQRSPRFICIADERATYVLFVRLAQSSVCESNNIFESFYVCKWRRRMAYKPV